MGTDEGLVLLLLISSQFGPYERYDVVRHMDGIVFEFEEMEVIRVVAIVVTVTVVC